MACVRPSAPRSGGARRTRKRMPKGCVSRRAPGIARIARCRRGDCPSTPCSVRGNAEVTARRRKRDNAGSVTTRRRRYCGAPRGGRAVRSRRHRSSRARFSGRPGPAGDSDDFGGARAHEAFRAVRRDLPPDARFCRERVRAAVAGTRPTASVPPVPRRGRVRSPVREQAGPASGSAGVAGITHPQSGASGR